MNVMTEKKTFVKRKSVCAILLKHSFAYCFAIRKMLARFAVTKSHYQFPRKILLKRKSILLFFKEELCYNKHKRRSRFLYLLCKYREIHTVSRGFEYLFHNVIKLLGTWNLRNFITLHDCAKAKLLKKAINVIIKSIY